MKLFGKDKRTYTILLAICVVLFWLFDNFYPAAHANATSLGGSISQAENMLWPASTTGDIVQHAYYALSYNEAYEQAEWVAYVLEKSQLTNDNRKRPYFVEDPKVRTKSADWKNYKGSGYDRGHLCPAADRRFTKNAYEETFYTSNISPQDRKFNAGIWNRLEQKVRYWAKNEGTLFVVTGGVLEEGLPRIGDEGVAVPNYFYKIIAKGSGEQIKIIAFLFPNKEQLGNLEQFVTSVDTLEKLTGIDFFFRLPNDQEVLLEANTAIHDWQF